MKEHNSPNSFPKWLIIVMAIGLIFVLFSFWVLTPKNQISIFNFSSILGTYITLCGFIIAIIQISSLKSTSIATKDAIQDTRNDIKRITTVADISKYVTIIRQIKEYIISVH